LHAVGQAGELSKKDEPEAQAFAAADAAEPALENRGHALAVEAVAATDFAETAVAGIAVAGDDPAVPDNSATGTPYAFVLDERGWRTVNRINRRMNREIRHVPDQELYGEEDRWSLPGAARGDCEDYVLAKRSALIEAGVAPEALSIAIVETPRGESHAVLLLASDRGEYVLDSLSPWVSRWDRVNYRWRERQAQGGAFDWVTIPI
jgi:predicted transglutaminase-like cysteine proteinase